MSAIKLTRRASELIAAMTDVLVPAGSTYEVTPGGRHLKVTFRHPKLPDKASASVSTGGNDTRSATYRRAWARRLLQRLEEQ